MSGWQTVAGASMQDLADEAESWDAVRLLRWAETSFAPRVMLATAFGAEGCVLIDLVARHGLAIDLVTLDTGLLFPETYALWQQLESRYGVHIAGMEPRQSVSAQAAEHGDRLWARDPQACCGLRKMEPLARALIGRDAWITAIRREQTAVRATARPIEWDDRHGLVKVNPLVRWTKAEVWAHIREHEVPYNPLHDAGYPSIGCVPCTSRVGAGEDDRAGRWRGSAKTECGLHVREGA
jgi:phosphoadenosine phosphosulfate reductase